ncbi:MAG TPA: hypothetical protein VFE13_21145 [Caulobacteraceae bacterium]|nr:hypothetical protein [Caulobacteraceae bacterium]
MLAALLPPGLAVFGMAAGLPGLVFVGGVSLLAYREIVGGARLGAGGAISAGVRKFLSLWGASLIVNVGVAIGLILLIVPGLVLWACLSPAMSAIMIEDEPAPSALDCAWRLARGSRWRMTVLLLAALAAILLLLLLTVVVVAALAMTLGLDLGAKVGRILWAPFLSILMLAVTTVGSTAAYVGLREGQQGASNVAEVFA